MTVEEIIKTLEEHWISNGCLKGYPYDVEKGAGTSNPSTFLMALGPKKWSVAHLEMCRRPQDGRYAENPNRVYKHHQFQVFIKPFPVNIEQLYLESLKKLGLDPKENDIKFLEDNWAQPTLGAWGLGSEVQLNGMEITQFTYFQQVGNIDVDLIPVEIAYGIERLAMYVQNVENVYDLKWNDNLTYGDMFKESEYQFSKYNFEVANFENYVKLISIYLEEAQSCLKNHLPLPAYDYVLKASHAFNILDSTKKISANERQRYILEISKVAKSIFHKEEK